MLGVGALVSALAACASAAVAPRAVEVPTPAPVPGCISGPSIHIGAGPPPEAVEPEVPLSRFDVLAGEVRSRATWCRARVPEGSGTLRASLSVMPNGEIGRLAIDADSTLPPELVTCVTQAIATTIGEKPALCDARTTLVVRF